jgi:hypothetical protein
MRLITTLVLALTLLACAPATTGDEFLDGSDESRLVWASNSDEFGRVLLESVKSFDSRYQSAYIQLNSDSRGLKTFEVTNVNIVQDELQVLFQVQEERQSVLYVKDTTVGGTDRERWRENVLKLEDALVIALDAKFQRTRLTR